MKALIVLFCLIAAFASGYIVGAVQHAQRPTEVDLMPPCSWAFMVPTPHKPGESWKCKPAHITDAETRRHMRRGDI